MSFPVAQTIKELGAPELAAATGIPLRTIYRWGQLNKVSGEGVVRDMRLLILKEAANKLQAAKSAPPKPKRKRAVA